MAQALTNVAAGVENLGRSEGDCQWIEPHWAPMMEDSAEKQASLSVELASTRGD